MDEWKSAACGAGKRSQRRNLQADGDSRNTARSASHCGVRMTIVSDMPILTTWRAQRNCDVSTTQPNRRLQTNGSSARIRTVLPIRSMSPQRSGNGQRTIQTKWLRQFDGRKHATPTTLQPGYSSNALSSSALLCSSPVGAVTQNRMPITTTVTLRSTFSTWSGCVESITLNNTGSIPARNNT